MCSREAGDWNLRYVGFGWCVGRGNLDCCCGWVGVTLGSVTGGVEGVHTLGGATGGTYSCTLGDAMGGIGSVRQVEVSVSFEAIV